MNNNGDLCDDILLAIVWLGVIGAMLTFDPVLVVMAALFGPAMIDIFTRY